jgi:glycosyltransferase involved in cell wall biosynthesis
MKIVIDISQMAFDGGVGRYTQSLVENLLILDSNNEYLLLAYTLGQQEVFRQFEAVLKKQKKGNFQLKLLPLPISLVEPLVNLYRIPPLETFTGKVDIYHASDWVQFPTSAKIVTTIHDMAPLIYPELHHPKIVRVFKRRLGLAWKNRAKIICVSQNTKKDFLKFYNFPEDNITVIPEAAVITPKTLEKKITPSQKPYLLTVSSLNPRKNIKRLIMAFEDFSREYPDYQLLVAGSFGWGEKYTNQKKITFLGKVDDNQLANLYANADIFVYPSLYEGFGLPLLEAMSFGCPVVGSNTSSLPEIVGQAGILVDPQNVQSITQGIKKALKCKGKLSKLALQQAVKFSWEKCARETLEVYRRVVGN